LSTTVFAGKFTLVYKNKNMAYGIKRHFMDRSG